MFIINYCLNMFRASLCPKHVETVVDNKHLNCCILLVFSLHIFTQLLLMWAPLHQHNRNLSNVFGHGAFRRKKGRAQSLHYAFTSCTTCNLRMLQYNLALVSQFNISRSCRRQCSYLTFGIAFLSLKSLLCNAKSFLLLSLL